MIAALLAAAVLHAARDVLRLPFRRRAKSLREFAG
jgi:hypothetical protein